MTFDNDELQDDEEETIVYVEFESTSGNDAFLSEKLQLDMIGLDTEHPIMRINGRHYEGTYEDAVGTCMLFDKDNPEVEDPVFDKTPNIRYNTKTKKILKMKRVFVKPRLEVLGDSNCSSCIPNIETIKEAGVPPKYQQDALLLWEKIRNERLEARNDYLEKQKQRTEKRQRGIEPDSDSDEDNPFVMYKNKDADDKINQTKNDIVKNKSQELNKKKIGNSSDILRVNLQRIDAPSSSKNSNTIKSSEKNVSVDKKTSKNNPGVDNLILKNNKKASSSKDNGNLQIIDTEVASCSKMTTIIDENKSLKNDHVVGKSVDEAVVDDNKSKESTSQIVNDTAPSKQQKRAAKMQEISERFRRSACLMKLQTDKTKKHS